MRPRVRSATIHDQWPNGAARPRRSRIRELVAADTHWSLLTSAAALDVPKKKDAILSRPFRFKLSGGLFQFAERAFDGIKVRQILRRGGLFAVLHHAALINHERRARRSVTHAGEHGENHV